MVVELRAWINQQPHLQCRDDEAFLLRFLRAKDFKLEMAQDMLDEYCTLRCDGSQWFNYNAIESPAVQTCLKSGLVVPLGKDDHGRNVLLFRAGLWDTKSVPFLDFIRAQNMVFDYVLADEATQTHGFVPVVDFSGFSRAQAEQWRMDSVRRLMRIQDAFPVTIDRVHYYKTPFLFNAVWEIFKVFMKSKLKDMVYWHKDSDESLMKEVPLRLLPSEYGGDAGPIDNIIEHFVEAFNKTMPDEVTSLAAIKLDESLRPKAG